MALLSKYLGRKQASSVPPASPSPEKTVFRGHGVRDQDVCDLALYAGHILLESGAELFRVEDTIHRILRAYGIHSENAFILSNGIFLTAGSDREGSYARVQHIPISSSHLDRVAAVNQLSREISEGRHTVYEARSILEQIRQMPEKKKWQKVLCSAIGSGSFCVLFGGATQDALTAFLVGGLLYLLLLFPLNRPMSKIVLNILSGCFVAGCAVLLWKLGLGQNLDTIIGGSLIPLVPGLAFTIGIRDLGNGDYISGSVRMLDALLVIFSVALGVGVMISVIHTLTGGMI